MKLGLMLFGLISLGLVGCTVNSTDSGGGASKTGPVSATPLAGTIEGKSFAGKFGVAKKSGFDDDGKRMISIYDREVPCSSFSSEDEPEAYLLISVPWEAGVARDFSFGGKDGQTATFVVKKADGDFTNIISTQGRVEIIEAPTEPGAKGTVRLRAEAKGNSVEGEVAVEVCE
jgi:hypothetical protein